ncbi:MAG: hypothetical protein CVT70_14960 [Alphaproteobacteria bacterium HGW-Alphaproteobacteria-1]|jgi:invasion protein IalB|nr:MAG: hypothetical protein CVT70_14960 [Alphaproteobacteria bacterium HGW-Alphaproteobacteria-1]
MRFTSPLRSLAWLPAGLLAALPALAQQAEGPDTLRETFRDWTVQCATPEGGARECEMSQTIRHNETGGTLLQFALRVADEDQVVGVLVAPFGLRLSQGVRVLAGETEIGGYGFDTCLASGCIVLAGFDEAALGLMRAVATGEVRAMARTGETLAIPVSFMGFSAGLARLRALQSG